jgi:hypothetical protein
MKKTKEYKYKRNLFRKRLDIADGLQVSELLEPFVYGIDAIIKKDRHTERLILRQVIQTYLRGQGWTTTDIGKMFNQNHATVCSSSSKTMDMMDVEDDKFMEVIESMREIKAKVITYSSLEPLSLVTLQNEINKRLN